jgi:PAS domain S-box-containing protein
MVEDLDSAGVELCEAAPDGIVIVDDAGRIVYVNRQAEAMFEAKRDGLVGRAVEVLMAPELEATHRAEREQFARAPHVRPMGAGLRLEGRRASGEMFPVEISLSPFDVRTRRYVMAAVRDVSAREHAEEELRETQAELATAQERDRIARDLHDTVIQQLFAVGMSLQSLHGTIVDPAHAERLEWAVDELDRTIREVRSVIFGLQSPRGDGGLRSQVMYLAREASRPLGFEPRVRFSGLVDTGISEAVGEQLVLATREALANVVRHAHANAADVRITVDGDTVRLVVTDDGAGITPGNPPGHGLRNLEERAAALGGTLAVTSAPGAGTTVEWRVPVA